jgi:hypothetical protein
MDVAKLTDTLKVSPAFDYRLFEIAGTSITVATLVTFAVIVMVTLAVSWAIQRAMVRLFRGRGVRDEGTLGVARRLAHYPVLAIGLGVGLQTIGINLAALGDPDRVCAFTERWPVVWVDVVGLGDAKTLLAVSEAFGLHPLALEDVVNVGRRWFD